MRPIAFLVFVLFLSGCKKDNENPRENLPAMQGKYILNSIDEKDVQFRMFVYGAEITDAATINKYATIYGLAEDHNKPDHLTGTVIDWINDTAITFNRPDLGELNLKFDGYTQGEISLVAKKQSDYISVETVSSECYRLRKQLVEYSDNEKCDRMPNSGGGNFNLCSSVPKFPLGYESGKLYLPMLNYGVRYRNYCQEKGNVRNFLNSNLLEELIADDTVVVRISKLFLDKLN